MPSKSQIRRRNAQRAASSRSQSKSPPSKPSTATSTQRAALWKKFKPILSILFKAVSAAIFGIILAASTRSPAVATVLLIVVVLLVFVALQITFISVEREHDDTEIHLPNIYLSNGTIVEQKKLTVYEHDRKCAHHFAVELPCLALATAWFFLWTLFPQTIAVYIAFLAFRLTFHPFFRIHLWKEPLSKDLGRPFGTVPLFEKDDSAPVKVVEGKQEFQNALDKAKGLVVLDCSATWCAPCKQMVPVFEQMAIDNPQITFLTTDIDVSRDLASELAIASVPSFVIYKDSQKMELIKGADPKKLWTSIKSYM